MPLQEGKQTHTLIHVPNSWEPSSVSIFLKVKKAIKLVSILISDNFLETAVLMLTLKMFLLLIEIIRLLLFSSYVVISTLLFNMCIQSGYYDIYMV